MSLQDFIDKYKGKKNDFDGVFGSQCVDLYDFYCRDVIGAPIHYVTGAKDIWENYPKTYFNRIPNTPTGIPQPGDVMIWGSDYGQWGHVAIVTEADVNKFKALSQNDPVGRKTHIKNYTYDFVLGWLQPVQNVNSSNNDMSNDLQKKASGFDRIWYAFKFNDKLPEEAEEKDHYEFIDWVRSNVGRAGNWDKLCIKAGITSNSSEVTVDELHNKLYKAEVVSEQSEQLLNLRKEVESLTKSLEESTKLVEQKEKLREKWYSLYETAKANFDSCKQGNATLQKKLTECEKKGELTWGELITRIWLKIKGVKV